MCDADELSYGGRLNCIANPPGVHEKLARIWKLVEEHLKPSLGWRCELEETQPAMVARLRPQLTKIDWGGNLDEVRKVINGESALTAELPPQVLEFARSPSCEVKYFAYYMAYWAAYLEPM